MPRLAINLILYLLTTLLFSSCSFGPYYNSAIRNWKDKFPADSTSLYHSVYLIGDAGGPSLQHQEPVLRFLGKKIADDSASTVVFLGDNIYYDGLPPETDAGREEAEKKINESLKILDGYKGQPFFIAGNHDWDVMNRDGLKRIRLQEEYIENYLNRGNTFLPDNGCPGPSLIKAHKDIVILAIDSQWWLHQYEKPYGRKGDCSAEDEKDFLVQVEDFVKNNRNKNIILVAHHPLVSNGNHGGYYNILDHIFPLRLIRSKLFIPLPGIGSIYPLYRKFGGVDQDIPNYRYQQYINEITDIIEKYDNVVYAAGHDHNLQYHEKSGIHHVLSGSGSKTTPVQGGGVALFTMKQNGFAIMKYYKNGQAWVEYWAPIGDGDTGELVFRYQVYNRKSGSPESFCGLSEKDYSDSTVTTKATEKYESGRFHRFLLGNHYRTEWTTPVNVPLINLQSDHGGLIPYGIGGGKQTLSLKLQDLDQREFVLRSINKNPQKRIPIDARQTIFEDIVEDQISAQHPYAAVTVAPMEQALNILHTNPVLVLIPNDSCLGPYKDQFSNQLALFQENPDKNHENNASLGFAKKIIGTDNMRTHLEKDNNNKVDERNFLRARMLDNLIGDWDRHEKQYRWAIYKTEKGELYKAIPEDRDQTYFKFDGLLPYLIHRKWVIRNLQNFDYSFRDVVGLNLSARNLDRRYLSSLNKNDWIQIADSVKSALNDSIIEFAVRRLPEEIFQLHGNEIIQKLKSRREQLPSAMEEYYLALAKYVDVFGSDKSEKFVIDRLNKNETKVTVYKISKKGNTNKKIYERIFYSNETKEVRLYGLAGPDYFELNGSANSKIKIRIIGGDDADTLNNYLKGAKNVVVYYDTEQNNTILHKGNAKLELSPEEVINYPSNDAFFQNFRGPNFLLAHNPDDGLAFGVGVVKRTYKFRSTPYGTQQRLFFSRANRTGANRIDYNADFRKVIRNYDLLVDLKAYFPYNIVNYFGYGNDTKQTIDNIHFYQTKVENIYLSPLLKKDIKKFLTVGLGPKLFYYKLRSTDNSITESANINTLSFDSKYYFGIRGYFKIGTRDNNLNPTRGISLFAEMNENIRLNKAESYRQFLSEFSFYISPNLPYQLTFATRLGAASNWGTYSFYQANAIGENTGIGQAGNLRGFRKYRYTGDKSLYLNFDVRLQLFKLNTYVFTSKVGLVAFIDNGKVKDRNQSSGNWHTGYGGGLWLSIFNKILLTGTYSLSYDDRFFNLRTGFLF